MSLMLSTVRLPENDDLVASDSIFLGAHIWVVMGLSESFTVRAPQCRLDYKHSKDK